MSRDAATETASTTPATPGAGGGGDAPAKPKSLRETLEAAAATVDAQEQGTQISETESAARVLRGESEYPEQKADKPAAKPKETETPAKAETKPKEQTKKTEAKPAENTGPERGEDGRFKSSQPAETAQPAQASETPAQTQASEAPKRFSKDAQAEWANAPESVRSEVNRAISEMEQGFEKHRAGAEKWSRIERYEQAAQQLGGTVEAALDDYYKMSQLIRQNPMAVIERLGQRHGFSLQDIASQVLQQPLSEYAEKANATINDLQKRLQAAEQQLGEFRQTQQTSINSITEQFAQDHPRFNELQDEIIFQLKQDHPGKPADPQERLKWAYARAVQLNPASEPASPAPAADPVTQPADLSAQTALAEKSISGAPGNGSNPTPRRRSNSTRDAVRQAAMQAGLA